MRSIGMQGDTVMLVSSGFVNITQFVAVIPAIVFIDRLGEYVIYHTRGIVLITSLFFRPAAAFNEYEPLRL